MSKGNKQRGSEDTKVAEKAIETAPEKKKEAGTSNKGVLVMNRTNQKQVVQLDGEHLVFTAYEKKELELTEKEATDKFSYWINKNIVQIKKK